MLGEGIPVLSPGTQIRHLTIDSLIGSGAFSNVYRCTGSSDTSFVALKVIPQTNIQSDSDRVHLQTELDAMTFLHHPNIVSLRDFFLDSDNYYLVLDYCDGGDLAEYTVEQQQLREPLVATIFQQIVSAISHCHSREIAHRDLKLQNILITTFPTVKVTDFGLACHFRDRQSAVRRRTVRPVVSRRHSVRARGRRSTVDDDEHSEDAFADQGRAVHDSGSAESSVCRPH
jgi:serine/threonine protein kinase